VRTISGDQTHGSTDFIGHLNFVSYADRSPCQHQQQAPGAAAWGIRESVRRHHASCRRSQHGCRHCRTALQYCYTVCRWRRIADELAFAPVGHRHYSCVINTRTNLTPGGAGCRQSMAVGQYFRSPAINGRCHSAIRRSHEFADVDLLALLRV
jgi:hypothetical protein